MRITIGSGKTRQSIELPCADIVRRGQSEHQKQMHSLICATFGIPLTIEAAK